MTTMIEQEQIRVLREALEDMGNPIAAMKREVPEGSVLNPHMAVQMAGDPEWYKRRARDALAATASIQPVAAPEPVAVIGGGWGLFWIGADPIANIVHRHGLKIGDKLYTAAPAQAWTALTPEELVMANEAIRQMAHGFMPNTVDLFRRLVAAAPAQAAPDEVRDAVLEEVAQEIDSYADSNLEGAQFEQANTFVRLIRALRTTSTIQAATPADSQKGEGDA